MGQAKWKRKWIEGWCMRMRARYGDGVREGDKVYTWREALARHAHGNADRIPPNPTKQEMEVADTWEQGEWPKWAERL